jgi:alkylation response protein AidB-like acyl-CoA dehydrogenase
VSDRTLLEAIHALTAKVDVLAEDVCEVKADLKDVKVEVRVTNGRVTKLEMWRHGLEVLAAARSWVKPALIGLATGAVLTVVTYALSRTY